MKRKTAGRPRKGKQVKQVYSVRLAPALADKAKRFAVDGKLTTAVEDALTLWVDRAEYRESLTDNQ